MPYYSITVEKDYDSVVKLVEDLELDTSEFGILLNDVLETPPMSKAQALLEVIFSKGGVTISNRANILRLTPQANKTKQEENKNSPSSLMVFKGTTLFIPSNSYVLKGVTKYFATEEDINDNLLDEQISHSEKYIRLINNEGYKPANLVDTGSAVYGGQNQISVSIYSRVIRDYVDVSNYVVSCSTSVTMNNGAFNISLEPSFFEEFGGAVSSVTHIDQDILPANTNFSKNDFVRIRFESLAMESGKDSQNVHDMFGFIDSVTYTRSFVDHRYNVNIRGRDVSKVLSDDTATAYLPALMSTIRAASRGRPVIRPPESVEAYQMRLDAFYQQASQSISAELGKAGPIARRNALIIFFMLVGFAQTAFDLKSFLSSLLNFFSAIPFMRGFDEERILGGLNALDDKPYSEFQDLVGVTNKIITESAIPKDFSRMGVWKLINLHFDNTVETKQIFNYVFSVEQSTAKGIMEKYLNSTLVEFFGDTYGDRYVFTFRKPPFDAASVRGIFDATTKEEDPFAAITAETGVIFDFPVEDDSSTSDIGKDSFLNIDENSIISEDLVWETRAYSWFRYVSSAVEEFINEQAGDTAQAINQLFENAIWFDEFAKIYGNSPLIVTSPYVKSVKNKDNVVRLQNVFRYIARELLYVIDSHLYLPYTRKGTIMIYGDRRFKIGTWIYHRKTNEVFYVTGVQNTFSISNENITRATRLTVERGMIRDYLTPKTVGINRRSYFDVSYFNLYNREELLETIGDPEVDRTQLLRSLGNQKKVNMDVMDFFENRLQFEEDVTVRNENDIDASRGYGPGELQG